MAAKLPEISDYLKKIANIQVENLSGNVMGSDKLYVTVLPPEFTSFLSYQTVLGMVDSMMMGYTQITDTKLRNTIAYFLRESINIQTDTNTSPPNKVYPPVEKIIRNLTIASILIKGSSSVISPTESQVSIPTGCITINTQTTSHKRYPVKENILNALLTVLPDSAFTSRSNINDTGRTSIEVLDATRAGVISTEFMTMFSNNQDCFFLLNSSIRAHNSLRKPLYDSIPFPSGKQVVKAALRKFDKILGAFLFYAVVKVIQTRDINYSSLCQPITLAADATDQNINGFLKDTFTDSSFSVVPVVPTQPTAPENMNGKRREYQSNHGRMISLENKLDNVKTRKDASTTQKFVYMSLFLLYLFTMFMFYIIDINVDLEMKARFSMLINGLLLVSLLIYEVVKLLRKL